MKRYFLLISIFYFLGINCSFSKVSDWHVSSLTPGSSDLKAVAMYSKDISIAVGDAGLVKITTDRGTSWTTTTVPDLSYLKDISFVSSKKAFCVGTLGGVFFTSDLGTSWERVNIGTKLDLSSIEFTGNVGFIAGDNILFRTIDSGKTWTKVELDDPFAINDVNYLTKAKWVAVGKEGKAIISLDMGNTWQDLNLGAKVNLKHVYRFLNDCSVIIGDSLNFFINRDGGDTWIKKEIDPLSYPVPHVDITLVFFKDADQGTIRVLDMYKLDIRDYYTFDGGTTWTYQSNFNPDVGTINSGVFLDQFDGFGVGFNGSIFNVQWLSSGLFHLTEYHGDMFTPYGYKHFIHDIDGYDKQNLAIISSYTPASLWLSNNGGKNWRYIKVDTFAYPNISGSEHYISYPAENKLIIALSKEHWVTKGNTTYIYNFGFMIRSEDGGQSFTKWDSPDSNIIIDLSMYDANNGIAGEGRGKFLLTSDGGVSWQEKPLPDTTYNIHKLQCLSPDTYFFYVYKSYDVRLLKTTDGGGSWTTSENLNEKDIVNFNFVDDQNGWAVGYSDNNSTNNYTEKIYHSSDGGITWIDNFPVDQTIGLRLVTVKFSDLNHGIAAGDKGYAYQTTNGGKSWQLNSFSGFEANEYLSAIYYPDSTFAILGSSSSHLVIMTPYTDGVSENGGAKETSIDIAPNPVAENIRLVGNFMFSSNDDMAIYSEDGRKVRTCKYSENIYVGDLNRGVYFLVIKDSVFKFVKK